MTDNLFKNNNVAFSNLAECQRFLSSAPPGRLWWYKQHGYLTQMEAIAAYLLEEIESLRSQRDHMEREAISISRALRSQLTEWQNVAASEHEVAVQAVEKLQQAEQERDEYRKLALRHAGRRKEAVDSEKEIDALLQKAQKANTAMREALEWYAEPANHPPFRSYDKSKATVVLSRYPKEGGEPNG